MQTRLPRFLLTVSVLLAVLALCTRWLFPNFVHALFSSDGFMPHSHCYFNKPSVIWLHVISDAIIGLSYVSISATLAFMVYRARRNIPFHWMFLAFGLFIISCGFTHFMEVLTIWDAVYWLAGAVKLVTAVASLATAIALFPLLPKVFALIAAVKVSEERRVKLLEANRELQVFASSISHDLRAPLRSMQGMANALRQDYAAELPPEALVYADRIVSASERMDDLIRDLLHYSQMNLSEFELQPVPLQAIMDELPQLLAANIKESNARVTFSGSFPLAQANRSLVLQVMTNLILNALKFVKPGVNPQVSIEGSVSENIVRIAVRDNGIGIAPEHYQRIFQMFERLHPAHKYPGTGLGLALVERAISRMHGRLGVDSEVGSFSCFWFELPKSPQPRTGT